MDKANIKWTEEECNFICSSYRTKSKDFIMSGVNPNRTWRSVRHKARFLGVSREPSANNTNIEFFDTWSANMAYLLGFIAADGCVGKNGTLQINLSHKDLPHLKKIRHFLSLNDDVNKIKSYYSMVDGKKYKKCLYGIGSKYLCNRLIALGINPNKTERFCFPVVPDKYRSHFIRGYFDGDGSISKDWHIDIIGTYEFLEGLSSHIANNCGINYFTPRKKSKKNAYHIVWGAKKSLKILNWIYADCSENTRLSRKHDQYINMKQNWTNYKSQWDDEELRILLFAPDDKEFLMNHLNRTWCSIYKKRWRLLHNV